MLTSIDVKFIFDSVCLSASLGDEGLFSSANILQIADVELSSCCSCYVFSQYTLVRLFLPRETLSNQVFSINWSFFWQLCCAIDVIFHVSQNSSKFGLVDSSWLWWLVHAISANPKQRNILNE